MRRALPIPTIPARSADTHKGDFGRVLIVAGSPRMSGAATLCGEAALRAGAGLVTLGIPESIHAIVASRTVCETFLPLPCSDRTGSLAPRAAAPVLEFLEGADALAIGPGLGQHAPTRTFLRRVLGGLKKPVVLDADALNLLTEDLETLAAVDAPKVITPHPGEMARLLGTSTARVQDDREESARVAARASRSVVILKGHRSVVTDGRRISINETGNPGMATGGSGDVLTGIVATLLAQRFSAFDAARLGAHVHGLAGDVARERMGEISMIATDLLEVLPQAFLRLSKRGGRA